MMMKSVLYERSFGKTLIDVDEANLRKSDEKFVYHYTLSYECGYLHRRAA